MWIFMQILQVFQDVWLFCCQSGVINNIVVTLSIDEGRFDDMVANFYDYDVVDLIFSVK